MKAVIYTRVSSEEQIEGTSLASQEELCRRYCVERGFETVAVFREEGETAKDLSLNNRTRFLAALEFCRKEKPIDAFVVFRVDRFARNTEDHFTVRRLLANHGTSLHSVTEPIGNRPAEKFIETVLAGAAEYDNAIRKQRCTDGLKARIAQGIWPLRPPIGYICAHHRRRGEKKTIPDQPDPVLFPLIQKALQVYARREIVSQSKLAAALNSWGFERVTGRKATKQLADRLLGRLLPFYAGVLVDPFTREEKPGLHIPMISRDELAQIRAHRDGRRIQPKTKRMIYNASFPLRRLVRCPECGRYLTACRSSGNGGSYYYYYCVHKRCSRRSKMLSSETLETNYARLLSSLEIRGALFAKVEERLRTLWNRHREERDGPVDQTAKRLEALERQRRRICEMREDGTYDAGESRQRLAIVDTQIADLKKQSARSLSIADLGIDELVDAARWYLGNLSSLCRDVVDDSRPRFERFAFPNGLVALTNADIRTTKAGLILAMAGHADSAESSRVHDRGLSSNHEYDYFADLIAYYRDSGHNTTLSHLAA
jgi:site-specific DNA recombinase